MIQLTTSGLRIAKDAAWAAQQQDFAQRHCAVLEGFLGESILHHVPRMLEHGELNLAGRLAGDRLNACKAGIKTRFVPCAGR